MSLVITLYVEKKLESIERSEQYTRKIIDEILANSINSGSQEAKKASESKNDIWRCSVCGKENRIGNRYCVACDNPHYASGSVKAQKKNTKAGVACNETKVEKSEIERAFRYLKDGNYDYAENAFDEILSLESNNPYACFGKLMCEHKTKTVSVVLGLSIDDDALYQRVKPYAKEEFFEEIRQYLN